MALSKCARYGQCRHRNKSGSFRNHPHWRDSAHPSRLTRNRNYCKGKLVMDTFLPPIEKPKSLIMKLAYAFSRRQYGKVLTPIKVHSARLPSAFGMFYGKISKLDK